MKNTIINRQGMDLKKGIPITIQLPKVILSINSYCQFETSEFGINSKIKVVASGYDSDIPEHLRNKEENRHTYTYSRIINDKIVEHPLYAQEVLNSELVDTIDRLELTADRNMHIALSVFEGDEVSK